MVSQKFWLFETVTPKSGNATTDVIQPTPIPEILLSEHSTKLADLDCDMNPLLMLIIQDYIGDVTFSDNYEPEFYRGVFQT